MRAITVDGVQTQKQPRIVDLDFPDQPAAERALPVDLKHDQLSIQRLLMIGTGGGLAQRYPAHTDLALGQVQLDRVDMAFIARYPAQDGIEQFCQ
jgi:hypothetical protein